MQAPTQASKPLPAPSSRVFWAVKGDCGVWAYIVSFFGLSAADFVGYGNNNCMKKIQNFDACAAFRATKQDLAKKQQTPS